MSNTQVGSVYQKIIEEVVDGSVNTFDEDGVPKSLLEDLKQSWQQKLSERRVAVMPWDPAPQMTNTPAAAATSSSTPAAAVKAEPAIKVEPQYPEYGSTPGQPGHNNVVPATYDSSSAIASKRAAQNLESKFGPAAASTQINQLHAQAQMAQKGSMAQYQQQISNSMKQRAPNMPNVPPQQQRATVASAQTDGAGDWGATLAQRRAVSDQSAEQADMTIRQRVDQMASELEGGGLMLPASERKARAPAHSRAAQKQPATSVAQYDGPAGDDDVKAELDEDAINSDLDDPDDDAIGETEDDPSTGELMLCTYERVQRVKNKWKCTLKDGVLTTGGKEYVFGKAQGEFEW